MSPVLWVGSSSRVKASGAERFLLEPVTQMPTGAPGRPVCSAEFKVALACPEPAPGSLSVSVSTDECEHRGLWFSAGAWPFQP